MKRTRGRPTRKETFDETENARVETLRGDTDAWIRLLESLLLDAEDTAIRRGDYALRECVIERDKGPEIYQSDTCSRVIANIRARYPRNNHPVKPNANADQTAA